MLISTLTYTPQPDVNVCHVPCAGVGPYQWLVMLTCGEWACGERVALWANAARPDAAQNPERQATTQNFERLWFLKILCRTPPPRAPAARPWPSPRRSHAAQPAIRRTPTRPLCAANCAASCGGTARPAV